MLLGCCHCESVSSSSSSDVPPSSSASSSEDPSASISEGSSVSTDTTCNRCDSDISPLRFRLTYSPAGSGCPCALGTVAGDATPDHTLSCAAYNGDFTLHKRSACSWSSNEKAILFLGDGTEFSSSLKKRFTLAMGVSSGHAVVAATIFFGYTKYYATFNPFTLGYDPPTDCTAAPINGLGDTSTPSSVTYRKVFPTATIDCLSSIGLDLFSISYGSSTPGSPALIRYSLAFCGIPMNSLNIVGSGFPTGLTIQASP